MNIVFSPHRVLHTVLFSFLSFTFVYICFFLLVFFYNTVPAILSQFFYQFFFGQLQCTELSIDGTMPLHECTSPGFHFFSSNLNATINAAFLSTQQNHTQWIRSNARTPQCSWFAQLECTFGILLFLLPPDTRINGKTTLLRSVFSAVRNNETGKKLSQGGGSTECLHALRGVRGK